MLPAPAPESTTKNHEKPLEYACLYSIVVVQDLGEKLIKEHHENLHNAKRCRLPLIIHLMQ